MPILLIIALSLVVLALSIYLGLIWSKLRAQRRSVEQTRLRMQAKVDDIKESIVTISKATLQGQCETSEACIRVYNLLSKIELSDQFKITQQFYEEIKDLSILEQRQALSARSAFNEDKIRFKSEKTYHDGFLDELRTMVRQLS